MNKYNLNYNVLVSCTTTKKVERSWCPRRSSQEDLCIYIALIYLYTPYAEDTQLCSHYCS